MNKIVAGLALSLLALAGAIVANRELADMPGPPSDSLASEIDASREVGEWAPDLAKTSADLDSTGEVSDLMSPASSITTSVLGRVSDRHGRLPPDLVEDGRADGTTEIHVEVALDGRVVATTRCQADGAFRLHLNHGGVLAIAASAPGWTSEVLRIRALPGAVHDVGTILIDRQPSIGGTTAIAHSDMSPGDDPMTPPPTDPPEVSIAGVVVDPSGCPISDALVQQVALPTSELPHVARTDREGRFRLVVAQSPRYVIVASKGRLRGQRTMAEAPNPPTELLLETEFVDLATVEGTVLANTDSAAITVTLHREGLPARFASLDRHGRFRFDDVAPGTILLTAFPDVQSAQRTVREDVPPNALLRSLVFEVTLSVHRDLVLSLASSRLARVSGHASDHGSPASHLAVLMTPLDKSAGGAHRRRVSIAADGSYEIADVVSGRYRIALVNRSPIELIDYSTPLAELELSAMTVDVQHDDHRVDLHCATDLMVFWHVEVATRLRLSQRDARESTLNLRRARDGFLVPREPLILRVDLASGSSITEPVQPLGDRRIDLRNFLR